MMRYRSCSLLTLLVGFGLTTIPLGPAVSAEFTSHPPLRSLPTISSRPLVKGPTRFVAPAGDDRHDGTEAAPWKTLTHAARQLKPGDTLYLRGGTYYETARITVAGTADQPITIASYPGELAVLDAGHRDFYESPAQAWEPFPAGGADEYRSTKSYPSGGSGGNFGDSLVPFHRYMTFGDLRATNELYREELNNRADGPVGMYAGPGARRDPDTGRIHIRLSHTQLDGLGKHAYRGETDPRKLPLVIVGADFGLVIEGAKHVKMQDLVIRGTKDVSLRISHGEQLEFDGVTLYANSLGLRTDNTHGLRFHNSAFRGHTAPWHSRFHHKNRAGAGYLVLTGPGDADFEFSHCDLTDHHDCMTFRSVDGMSIHHCLIENFNDDGIEPGPKKERGRTVVYQNRIAQILGPFTAHGNRTEPMATEPGSGVYVYRNVVDLRQGIYKTPPASPDPSGSFLNEPTTIVASDHGSPTLPNYYVYHNTFLMADGPFRNYYGFTWGAHTHDTVRRVFNNIFVQVNGVPALNYTAIAPADDFQADGNLFWAVKHGPEFSGDLFRAFRSSPQYVASQRHYAPGWSTHDRWGDPKFVALAEPGSATLNVGLQPDSPAIDAGVPIPSEWPDVLREQDRGQPDLGALPRGVELWHFGVSRPSVSKP
ncbi:MAG: hypothetical protein JNM18_20780 [Planctomycetaceae bacterium]|nr:hypothetical protein [Planctomycetaceae bacterium]